MPAGPTPARQEPLTDQTVLRCVQLQGIPNSMVWTQKLEGAHFLLGWLTET